MTTRIRLLSWIRFFIRKIISVKYLKRETCSVKFAA